MSPGYRAALDAMRAGQRFPMTASLCVGNRVRIDGCCNDHMYVAAIGDAGIKLKYANGSWDSRWYKRHDIIRVYS